MEYQTLKSMFYKDRSNERFERNDALAKERRNADSTFLTGIESGNGEFFMAVPRELSVLSENVLRFERKVSRLASELPLVASGALIRDLVISEVVSTNELEGVHSSRKQINDVLEAHRERPRRHKDRRFTELVKLYLNLTESYGSMPRTPEDVRSIYDRVMHGEDLGDDAPDGKIFRKREEVVCNDAGIPVHEGLFPESRIIEAITKMLVVVNSENVPQIYSAIIGHFIFEFTHPFYDGNGRTGRYLLALWLSEPLSLLTSLSLSRVIFENKDAYYRSFKRAEHPLMHGELTFFVLEMLGFVRQAQEELVTGLNDKKARLDAACDQLEQFKSEMGLSDREGQLLYLLVQVHLFASPAEVGIQDMSNYLQCSIATARKCSRDLEARGLLMTISKRPLRFVLSPKALELLGIQRSGSHIA